jgi:hypothetical protein
MKKALAAALPLLLALALSAQEPGAVRIMASLSSVGIPEEGALRDSLEAALAASPLAAAVLRYEAGDDDLPSSASKASCPIALSVEASGTGASLRVAWRYLSAAPGNAELRSGSFEKALPGARDLVSSFWTEVVQDIAPAIEALPSPATVASGGPSPEPGPAEGRIPSWTAELSLYGFSFLEARASYLMGKRFFVRLTLTQFLSGLNLQDYQGPPPDPPLFSSYTLLQAGTGFGAYFEDPSRSFRLYAALDAFLRIAMPFNKYLFVDPGAPVGLVPMLGAEWGLDLRIKAYLELGAVFYPYADTAYMYASRGQNGGNAVASGHWFFSPHPGWFFEFPLPRLGLRLYF